MLSMVMLVSLQGMAQSLSLLEYWFDGKYSDMKSTALSGTEANLSLDIATKGLDVGLHWLYMRTKDSDGTYSGISVSPFIKSDPSAGNKIEYWFEKDYDKRGVTDIDGSGTTISIDDMLDLSDAQKFPMGFHQFNFRVISASGAYSPISKTHVMLLGSGEPFAMEYWLDDDQTASQTIEGTKNADGSYSIFADIDLSGAPVGFHRFYYRVMSPTRQNMGSLNVAYIMTLGSSAPSALEYWLDEDEENSRIVQGTKNADGNYSIVADLDLSGAIVGFHRLHYRITSANNQMKNNVNTAYIMVLGGDGDPVIEFWLDDDMEHTRSISAEKYGDTYFFDEELDLSDVAPGLHRLYYRLSSPSKRISGTLNEAAVMVMPKQDFFTQSGMSEIVEGKYWFDEGDAQPFLDFEPGEMVDIEEIINAASLENGMHVLSMQFKDSNGRWTAIDQTRFIKVQFNETESIDGILYKYFHGEGHPYVGAIGYEEGLEKADIRSLVAFGGKDYKVIFIDEKAFYGCTTMNEVATLPASIEKIGNESFAATTVKEVALSAPAAPVFGTKAFPQGTNVRVPHTATTGYDKAKTQLAKENVLLTYDLGCIYDQQWEALKRIDDMVRAQGGSTGWDFTDRASTPEGVVRRGTDNVLEIDLSNHGLSGTYVSTAWTDGLPKLNGIFLEGNSIKDITNSDSYGMLHLDEQKYDYVQSLDLRTADADELLTPEIPLIFRDANTGVLGNPNTGDITYCISTKKPNGDYVSALEQNYSFLLTVTEDGNIRYGRKSSGTDDVYYGESGQLLCVTGSGNKSLIPNSYYTMNLYFGEGDVDMNGETDITDLQRTINYIFGDVNRSYNFAWNAANTYKDETINIQDVVCTSNILIGEEGDNMKDSFMAKKRVAAATPASAEAYVYVSGGKLILHSDKEVAALDILLDINGSADWYLDRLGFSENAKANHVVAYSFSGRTLPAGETILADIKGEASVSRATLSDIDANKIRVAINSEATSIGHITDTDGVDGIYDASGVRRSNLQPGINIIKANGVTKKVFIK